MKETLISLEVAKLAKEKGFPQDINTGIICRLQNLINKSYKNIRSITKSDIENKWCIFNEIYPTQSLLQKWLREKHNLHIEIEWDYSEEYEKGIWSDPIYRVTIVDISYTKEWKATAPDWQRSDGKQLTYEGALEVALLEALKSI